MRFSLVRLPDLNGKAGNLTRFNLVMADELGRELESLVRLELGLLGLNTS